MMNISLSDKPAVQTVDGNTKPTTTAPKPVEATPSLPLADKDFIPADFPFEGQQRKEGEKLFEVQLKGEPQYLVFAVDRLQAIQRYNKKCGVIATVNPHEIRQLD